MTHDELLDAEELMHLALQASERLDSGGAIEYLKRLLQLEPGHPEGLYLLGAQEAQIGLFSRALEHMSSAIALRPQMSVARFQLGWLQLNSGHRVGAQETWKPLDELGEDHPFVHFKTGLLHLAHQELAEGLQCLQDGIAVNTLNAPLNADMATLVEQVKRRLQTAAAEPGQTTDADADVPTMYLDAYTGKRT